MFIETETQFIRWKLRSSRPEVFCKKVVLKNFAKFTEKHLCQSLFLIKLQAFTLVVKIWLCSGYFWVFFIPAKHIYVFFVYISSIESVEKLLTCSSFLFNIFTSCLRIFFVKRFCIRQHHLMLLLLSMYSKTL